jgi:hypothetical protein
MTEKKGIMKAGRTLIILALLALLGLFVGTYLAELTAGPEYLGFGQIIGILIIPIVGFLLGKKQEKATDYGTTLAVIGIFLGSYMGYILRPLISIDGMQRQLSLSEMRLVLMHGYGNLLTVAVTSYHYIIAGALIGLVLGWVLGKNTKRKSG